MVELGISWDEFGVLVLLALLAYFTGGCLVFLVVDGEGVDCFEGVGGVMVLWGTCLTHGSMDGALGDSLLLIGGGMGWSCAVSICGGTEALVASCVSGSVGLVCDHIKKS